MSLGEDLQTIMDDNTRRQSLTCICRERTLNSRNNNTEDRTMAGQTRRNNTHGLHLNSWLTVVAVITLTLSLLPGNCKAWKMDPVPKSRTLSRELSAAQVQTFMGNITTPDHFKILLTEGDSMIVGARNYVYNISLLTLKENKRITWFPTQSDITICSAKGKPLNECQNYIRVIARMENSQILVCGTNAFNPKCRKFAHEEGTGYESIGNIQSGLAMCPFDPTHNNTAVYAGGRLYAGTVTDFKGRDHLIYTGIPLRTVQHDSQVLNDPDFVNSFEYKDHVYFFFREAAVEYINCGKATYSRVGRVCKNDRGGSLGTGMEDQWTSFFKSRLNCSIPGEKPFYFDEIQSTTEQGEGNYYPSSVSSNKTDMIYAVFNTPSNSITGSAVCAFRFHDVEETYQGAFKEQASAHHNWLPTPEKNIPQPSPAAQCSNNSLDLGTYELDFIKLHPLMDRPVPAFGGEPILIQTSFQFRLTQIAVDWQVPAADGRFYDVLFIGTDDGRVIKAINKGQADKIETVVIEDIEVFPNRQPVVNLKVYRNANLQPGHAEQQKLVVVSRDEIKSIPLYRCHLQRSCGKCVALQDPYCSWTAADKCEFSNQGTQNVNTGFVPQCSPEEPEIDNSLVEERPEVKVTEVPPCNCPPVYLPTSGADSATSGAGGSLDTTTERVREMTNPSPHHSPGNGNHFPVENQPAFEEPEISASTQHNSNKIYSAQSMAIAVVFSMLFSLVVGFLLGYFFMTYRNRRRESDCIERKSIEKNSRWDKDANHFNAEPNIYNQGKQNLNVVFNPLKQNSNKMPNGSTETKIEPPPKAAKKVYL